MLNTLSMLSVDKNNGLEHGRRKTWHDGWRYGKSGIYRSAGFLNWWMLRGRSKKYQWTHFAGNSPWPKAPRTQAGFINMGLCWACTKGDILMTGSLWLTGEPAIDTFIFFYLNIEAYNPCVQYLYLGILKNRQRVQCGRHAV